MLVSSGSLARGSVDYSAPVRASVEAMRATVMFAAGDVRIENVPDPRLVERPDALIRVTRGAFYSNISVSGGPAPVRARIDDLLPDVLEGRIQPGRVFDRAVSLDEVLDGYRAMNDREAIKVMVEP
jgi:threonine dehydrogenase-like Zn-dependent dehydrogenase